MSEYLLPDVGEGLIEAEIVSWKVKVGDEVKINDVVVEIETAKSLVELPSPYAGVVSALLVPEGETVPVGTPIIRIDDGVEAPAAPASPAPAESSRRPSGTTAPARDRSRSSGARFMRWTRMPPVRRCCRAHGKGTLPSCSSRRDCAMCSPPC